MRNLIRTLSAAGLVIAAPVTLPAQDLSQRLGLFNTGVDVTGQILGAGQNDPHFWVIRDSNNPDITTSNPRPAVVVPVGPNSGTCRLAHTWLVPANDACWIWSHSSLRQNGTSTVTFQTVFNVGDDINMDGLRINGFWATDNSLLQVRLNDVPIGGPGTSMPGMPNFQRLTAFDLDPVGLAQNLRRGPNTLSFDVYDYGNRGGFLINDIRATIVPEPASLALVGLGLVGVCARRRRRTGEVPPSRS